MLLERIATLSLCAAAGALAADEPTATIERVASLASLFPAAEAQALSQTLPADQQVKFRVHIPRDAAPGGVLVFVKPVDSGAMPAAWQPALDRRNLIWISAENFGNDKPSAQRMLVAVMGLRLIRQTATVDTRRLYVAGMSGGGRVASQLITHFPQLFTGAIYIVGADFWMPETPLRELVTANRYVFVTGSGDFNRREMKRVFSKYQAAGVAHALFMDLPGFAHEYPSAEQLMRAIDFLDAR